MIDDLFERGMYAAMMANMFWDEYLETGGKKENEDAFKMGVIHTFAYLESISDAEKNIRQN